MAEDEKALDFSPEAAEFERSTFGKGGNKVTIPLAEKERALLEEIAAVWGVSVPLAARRLLLLAASVSAP